MPSRAKEEMSDTGDCEGRATRNGEAKKTVCGAETVPLHYIPDADSMVSSTNSRKAHHVFFSTEIVKFWRKGSSYTAVLYHVNYKSHGKVPTRQSRHTNGIDGTIRLNEPRRWTPL